VKMRLAQEVIGAFHGKEEAKKAAQSFQRVFRDRQAPEDMKEIRLQRAPGGLVVIFPTVRDIEERMTLPLSMGVEKWSKLLAFIEEAPSASEVERIIKQGGFEVDDQIVKDPACKLNLEKTGSYKIRLGKKKFLRVVVE